jgi:hypothetical protein
LSLFIPALTPALDGNGNTISDATWNFYRTGTSSPEAVYADFELETSLGAVVTANSSGKFVPIYLDPAVTYRAVLEDDGGDTIDDIDPYDSGTGAVGEIVDITDFGIVAGDSDVLADANSDAVDELLAYLLANIPTPDQLGTAAIRVTAPAGHFRFARPWVVKCALWLEGQSNAMAHGYATHFDFDEGGFELHGTKTDHDGLLASPTTGANGFRIENLYCTSRAATGTGHHGFYAVTRGEFIRCTAALFPGDGFRIESLTGFGASDNNANSSRILYCKADGNGGNGIHLLNGDANCVITEGCDLSYNGGFGLFDNAFLSNKHGGHHTVGNGLGLVFDGHKISAVSSVCYYPITAWAAEAIAVSAAGTYRSNASKLYRLLKAGGGAAANAPTHTTVAADGPATGADGYQWAYEGTTLTRRYHVALGQTVAASTTVPGTDSAVWVPYYFAGAATGIPLWVTGMTWKEGGSYCIASTAGDTVAVACYGEEGHPPAQVRAPSIWIGGQTAPSTWSTSVQVRSDDGALINPKGFVARAYHVNGDYRRAEFGNALGQGIVIRVAHVSRHLNSFQLVQDTDTYALLDGQSENFVTFTGPATTFTGGRSTIQPGMTVIPRLFVGAGASARAIDYGSAAPASGYHAAGEVVYNTAPAAGGKVGWVCTTAGTPGTWKPFGAIDA